MPDIWKNAYTMTASTAATAIHVMTLRDCRTSFRRRCFFRAQHCLYGFPEPHGHGWFGLGFTSRDGMFSPA
jgi:hypothetical protein